MRSTSGSFAVRDHLRSNLGIISGLGIICGRGSFAALYSTFHKAIEFSLKKLGKPKLDLRREQYDAIRAICFERKDALAILPTGFRKSLIYREFLTTFEAAVSLNVIILLCLLCHPEAGS